MSKATHRRDRAKITSALRSFPWSVERQSVKRGDAFELRTLNALTL